MFLYFLSGFCCLSFEIVWVRVLSVVFGRTSLAVTIVTSTFMAGLGLGSMYWGKKGDRVRNPLSLFSLLQLGIGVSSVIILGILHYIPFFYATIGSSLSLSTHSRVTIFIIALFSFGLLFIPTFFMGGTLPLISKYYIRRQSTIAQGLGFLYASNSFGAVIGVAITGYGILALMGNTLTQLLYSTISISLGIYTWYLAKGEQNVPLENSNSESAASIVGPDRAIKSKSVLLGIIGLMGLCGMALEIIIMRVLSIFLINSSYIFSSILIVFLTGITVGSFLYSKIVHSFKNQLNVIFFTMGTASLYCIIMTAYLNDMPQLLGPIKHYLFTVPILYYTVPGIILSTVLLFIPTLCMGILFPALCRLYSAQISNLSKDIGVAYFINTLGSIAGPLVASFVLIPLIGISKGIMSIAILYLGSAIVLVLNSKQEKNKFVLGAACLVSIVAIPFVVRSIEHHRILPPSIFRTPNRNDSLLYYQETIEGSILVNEDRNTGLRYLYVNNTAVVGTTYDAIKTVKMLATLPFCIEPQAKKILVIGFGMGITAAEFAKQKSETVECVEICPGIKKSAPFFGNLTNNVLNNPKVSFIGADGRTHLLLTQKKYDIISCDPSHPTLGSGNLYTIQYFALCKKHLTAKGIMSQYIPLHLITESEFQSIVKSFISVFEHATLWLGQSHCLLIGTQKPLLLDFTIVKQNLGDQHDEILNDPYNLLSSLLLDSRAVKQYVVDAPFSSDEKPILDYHSLGGVHEENWHKNLRGILKFQIDGRQYVKNIENPETFSRYLVGQKFFMEALMRKNQSYKSLDDLLEVIQVLKKAFSANPENIEIQSYLSNELDFYHSLPSK